MDNCEWKVSTPERQGVSSAGLLRVFDAIEKGRKDADSLLIHGLILIRNGCLIAEVYFHPFATPGIHDLASVTKSITSALVGIAIDKGYLQSVHQPVLDLLPTRLPANLDDRKRRVTVEHLLTMTSGFACGLARGEPELTAMQKTSDWVQYALDLPMWSEPGTQFAYCSPNNHLLSAIMTEATGVPLLEFARRHLFAPLRIEDPVWPVDSHALNHGWGNLRLHPRELARFGCLYLNDGRWGDTQVVPSEWVERSRQRYVSVPEGGGYGYGWWVRDTPAGAFEALGRGGQRVVVLPAKNAVIVTTGGGFGPNTVIRRLVAAMKSDRPLPEDPEALGRLQQQMHAAAEPPDPQPAAPLPETAAMISGREWVLEGNALGIAALSVTFAGENEAIVRLDLLDGRQMAVAAGLDNVYRTSSDGFTRLPSAAKCRWQSDREFAFYYDDVGRIHGLEVSIRFEDEDALVRLNERSGLFNETVRARLR